MALVVEQVVSTKTCYKCKLEQPTSNFSRSPSKSDGFYTYCKKCANEKQRYRYQNNINGHRDKDNYHSTKNHYKSKYGLADEVIAEIMKSRFGTCEICKIESDLVVDHCHNTSKVRGRICQLCNTLLGHAKDNVDTLMSAIEYLKANK